MHPLTLETLASSHRADLLAEAANHRLAHAGRQKEIGPGSSQVRLLRLRHGLATMLAAAVIAAALVLR